MKRVSIKTVPDPIKRQLFAVSGGFCMNPHCNRYLFTKEQRYGVFNVAEVAHISAVSPGGARYSSKQRKGGKNNFDNLILLCANCHTVVDKNHKKYTADVLRYWKKKHMVCIESSFGRFRCVSREELRSKIEPLLLQNREIFERFGPHNDYQYNPESSGARIWRRNVIKNIIPNSERILQYLENSNVYLLVKERKTLGEFRLHVDGLIECHIEGQGASPVQFPTSMDNICS